MKRIENELKMKRTKNRLAVMLAMILCVKLLPVTAYAATFNANDWDSLQTAVADALAHTDAASTITLTA